MLAGAVDIDALRGALERASTLLINQVKEYGKDQTGNVYVAHCPMAFDDTGADWLTSKPKILNPYFGAAMLNCGAIRENLSFDPDESPPTLPHLHDH